ncbi:hypothetical protein CTheo_6599 [Ceratobasidium theobromae]|uniref:Uncharacterized protein n=1 Tax=Ceratobasidium theobromae TaxID=1582974 RepID=A0A5N5QEB5_9AGAM|nr:hypothetical protein CTheo_6599 [Ceratobasidium theobromae]
MCGILLYSAQLTHPIDMTHTEDAATCSGSAPTDNKAHVLFDGDAPVGIDGVAGIWRSSSMTGPIGNIPGTPDTPISPPCRLAASARLNYAHAPIYFRISATTSAALMRFTCSVLIAFWYLLFDLTSLS